MPENLLPRAFKNGPNRVALTALLARGSFRLVAITVEWCVATKIEIFPTFNNATAYYRSQQIRRIASVNDPQNNLLLVVVKVVNFDI